jgi:hypothetical protein
MEKLIKKNFGIIFTGIMIISTVLLIMGCSSFTLTGNKYPALADDARVQVIMRAVPDYKVEQIGILSTECFMEKDCIVKAQKIARQNGGDVVVLSESGIVYRGDAAMQVRVWEICKMVAQGKKK